MCIFCKISNSEIPSSLVEEDEDFMAFHDIHPKAPIHILIIPKKHIENFQTMPEDLMGKMTSFMQSVATKVGVDKSGYRLVTNNGSDGGQEVFHLHFHLLGGGKLKWDHNYEDPHRSL